MKKVLTTSLYLVMATSAFAGEFYAEKQVYSSGAGNVMPSYGGEYVYGEVVADGRREFPAMLLSSYVRHDYALFSYEEESELRALKDQKLAKFALEKEAAERKAYLAKVSKYDWPKIVVNGDQVCVPELASSEANNWKGKLTCYSTIPDGSVEEVLAMEGEQ